MKKKKKELILWEEYLIYSVIFDLNDTGIVQNISRLIDIKYELGKFYFIKNEKKSIPKIIIPK